MQLELVSIATDTHPLDGLFYRPASPIGAALFMHGNCMNFYTGPARFIPAALARAGYACLAYNRRGHDVIATLNSRQAVGGAFQMAEEAIADNRFAAEWLVSRGFTRPIVVGHSNGGVLGVRHVADHPDTPALILLSAQAFMFLHSLSVGSVPGPGLTMTSQSGLPVESFPGSSTSVMPLR